MQAKARLAAAKARSEEARRVDDAAAGEYARELKKNAVARVGGGDVDDELAAKLARRQASAEGRAPSPPAALDRRSSSGSSGGSASSLSEALTIRRQAERERERAREDKRFRRASERLSLSVDYGKGNSTIRGEEKGKPE